MCCWKLNGIIGVAAVGAEKNDAKSDRKTAVSWSAQHGGSKTTVKKGCDPKKRITFSCRDPFLGLMLDFKENLPGTASVAVQHLV